MPVYTSTTYYGDNSNIQEPINELHKNNLIHIEIGSNHLPINIKSLSLFPKTKYIIHNYFPSAEKCFVLNIASTNSGVREESISFIKNTIRTCSKLNIKFYTIHPGFLGEALISEKRKEPKNYDFKFNQYSKKTSRTKIIDRTIRVIKNLYEFANKYEVQILIENEGSITSKQFVIFSSIQELDMLKLGVGSNFVLNFNLAHALLSKINLDDDNIFKHFYMKSDFFEVSEIQGIYDSHKPVMPGNGQVSTLLRKYSHYFAKKDVILEYRNVNIRELKKSHNYVVNLLDSSSPPF